MLRIYVIAADLAAAGFFVACLERLSRLRQDRARAQRAVRLG